MRTILIPCAAALLLAACGGSPSADQRATAREEVATAQAGGSPKPLATFDAMDADGDGTVTAVEHSTAASTMFVTMDTDNNDAVTAAEMDAAAAKMGGPATTMSSAEKIKAVDMNTDTIVSSAEHIAGAAAMFVKMDADRSGSLSRAEFNAGHAGL